MLYSPVKCVAAGGLLRDRLPALQRIKKLPEVRAMRTGQLYFSHIDAVSLKL